MAQSASGPAVRPAGEPVRRRGAISRADTHGILMRPEHRLLASSDGKGWRNLFAAVQVEAPYQAGFGAVEDHLLVLHFGNTDNLCVAIGDQRQCGRVASGHFNLVPAGFPLDVDLTGTVEIMHIYLKRSVVDGIAAEMGLDPARLELPPLFDAADGLVEQLALGLRNAMADDGMAGALYADHLGTLLAAHLVRGHCRPDWQRKGAGDGLSERQLRRVRDYIEADLDQPIDVGQLASVAGLSSVYFARQFKRATGMAPHQFLLRRRIERARQLLATSDRSIVDIALSCGFCHQEHLTRTFRQICGTTPAAFRHALTR